MLKLGKRGQNVAEYALVIGLVVAAAMAMQTYVSRSLQSGIKYTANKLVAEGDQYEPYYLQTSNTTTVEGVDADRKDTEFIGKEGTVDSHKGLMKTTRDGKEIITDVPVDAAHPGL